MSDSLILRLAEEPPRFPFFGRPFKIVACSYGADGHPKSPIRPVQLAVTLYNADTRLPLPPDEQASILTIESNPKDLVLPSGSGKTTITLTIAQSEQLLVSPKLLVAVGPAPSAQTMGLEPVFSKAPFTCVFYRLLVQAAWPSVWYKDEGGRDKGLDCTIRLLNSEGKSVTGKPIPLKFMLTYEDDTPVTKQEILRVLPDSETSINRATGIAYARVRIEDVSKNHQNQKFRVRVSPDLTRYPEGTGVSLCSSPAVAVRSKRNKRRGKDKAASTPSGALTTTTLPGGQKFESIDLSMLPSTEGVNRSTRDAINQVVVWSNLAMKTIQETKKRLQEVEQKYMESTVSCLHQVLRHIHGDEVFESALRRDKGRRPPSPRRMSMDGYPASTQPPRVPASAPLGVGASGMSGMPLMYNRLRSASESEPSRTPGAPSDAASVLGAIRAGEGVSTGSSGSKRPWPSSASATQAAQRQRVQASPARDSRSLQPIRVPGMSGGGGPPDVAPVSSVPMEDPAWRSESLMGSFPYLMEQATPMAPLYRLYSDESMPATPVGIGDDEVAYVLNCAQPAEEFLVPALDRKKEVVGYYYTGDGGGARLAEIRYQPKETAPPDTMEQCMSMVRNMSQAEFDKRLTPVSPPKLRAVEDVVYANFLDYQ